MHYGVFMHGEPKMTIPNIYSAMLTRKWSGLTNDMKLGQQCMQISYHYKIAFKFHFEEPKLLPTSNHKYSDSLHSQRTSTCCKSNTFLYKNFLDLLFCFIYYINVSILIPWPTRPNMIHIPIFLRQNPLNKLTDYFRTNHRSMNMPGKDGS